MKVQIDEQSYVIGWDLVEEAEGLECAIPEDFPTFEIFYSAYKYSNGQVTLDQLRLNELQQEDSKNLIREDRRNLCFPYINRGPLWYAKLTEEQILELNQWYNDWLNAPETGIIPEQPSWLK